MDGYAVLELIIGVCIATVVAIFLVPVTLNIAYHLVDHGHVLHTNMAASVFVLFYHLLTIAFVLAELEYLRLLVPHVTSISPSALSWAQGVVSCIALVFTLSSFYRQLPSNLTRFFNIFNMIVAMSSGIYDLCQQLFLLYVVYRKLRKTSTVFRIGYTALIGLGCCIFGVGCALAVVNLLAKSRRYELLSNLSVPAFTLCSMGCMETLRHVLQNKRKRRDGRQPPRTPADCTDPQETDQSDSSAAGRDQFRDTRLHSDTEHDDGLSLFSVDTVVATLRTPSSS
ncbi:hypothetical protein BC831DRAFT_449660, partial [Entophlyctis helioformis]